MVGKDDKDRIKLENDMKGGPILLQFTVLKSLHRALFPSVLILGSSVPSRAKKYRAGLTARLREPRLPRRTPCGGISPPF